MNNDVSKIFISIGAVTTKSVNHVFLWAFTIFTFQKNFKTIFCNWSYIVKFENCEFILIMMNFVHVYINNCPITP